jgi:hypothetical protein
MSGRLVVVGALAAVVPQVERGLQGLVAVRVVGLMVGRTPAVGVHVVHGDAPREGVNGMDDEPPRGGAGASEVVGRTHEDQVLGFADRARGEVLCGSAAERLVRS